MQVRDDSKPHTPVAVEDRYDNNRKFSLLTLQLPSIPSIFAVMVLMNHDVHAHGSTNEAGNEWSEFVLSQTSEKVCT
jgi:hypothetical protein